jgi:ketosteroid isomerase-like protein
MPTFSNSFDPLAVVVDWLDACRSGDLDALRDLYDEEATLECDREYGVLVGREAIVAYWDPLLERRLGSSFTLDDLSPSSFRAQVNYCDENGEAARIHFHFSYSGKILHTTCRPRWRCAA